MPLTYASPGDNFQLADSGNFNEMVRGVRKANQSDYGKASGRLGDVGVGEVDIYGDPDVMTESIREFRAVAIKKDFAPPGVINGQELKPDCTFAKGLTFTLEDIDTGKDQVIAILQEPLGKEKFAKAKIFGASQVFIDVTDINHKYATLKTEQPTDGTSSQFDSAISGGYRITSELTETGEQWCSVRFPVSQSGGGTVIEVVQVKTVDEMNAEVQVAPITLLLDELPNYESSDDDYFWKTVNFLKDE